MPNLSKREISSPANKSYDMLKKAYFKIINYPYSTITKQNDLTYAYINRDNLQVNKNRGFNCFVFILLKAMIILIA